MKCEQWLESGGLSAARMKREWITRKAVPVPPAPTGRTVTLDRGNDPLTLGSKPGETKPELRVRGGHGGKTSLAVCSTLSA